MTDCYYATDSRSFSPDFVDMLGRLVDISRAATKLPAIEVNLLRDLFGVMASGDRSAREISLSGLTDEGIERLERLLVANGVAYRYLPMKHHYRAPSEPARLYLMS